MEVLVPLSRTENRTSVCSVRRLPRRHNDYPTNLFPAFRTLPSLFDIFISTPISMLAHLVSNFPRRTIPSARRAISVQVPTSPRARSRALMVHAQSILHGSKDAKEAGDHEIQQHSRLVARGKYIHGIESTSRIRKARPIRVL
jgi:hypothetical protein